MNIGQAAAASGVSAKMIRHYESIGLLPPASRSEAGYRRFDENDVHTLGFIRRSRDRGFSIDAIGQLLALWRDRRRASSEIKSVAKKHLAELERKILELEKMRRALSHLVRVCHGDRRPECPIIDDLAKPGRLNGTRARKPRPTSDRNSARRH